MEYKSDFVVIGSGIAGLSFALKVAEYGTVSVVTQKDMMEGNTLYAQGGIASVFDPTDSFELHIQDTLQSGDGLCNQSVVEMVVRKGPPMIKELSDMGVQFNTRGDDSAFDLAREGGHSRNRVVHVDDMTGRDIQSVLVEKALGHKNISVFENHMAIDLITYSRSFKRGIVTSNHEDFCCGVYALKIKTGEINTFSGKVTVLATGGACKVYLYTSNPDGATGAGIAMAYRAGARVSNLEFVQFHPTCLYHPAARNFLISEAVRGEGGVLRDSNGRAFMQDYDPLKDLACRDVVARSIDMELKKSGDEYVYLDITHRNADFIRQRFPSIYQKCLSFGIDMTKDPIPVVPAAHYMCGGVVTDEAGRTDIRHLYAIGEVACTGLHGANRLASNSLLEALVYSHEASQDASQEVNSGIAKWRIPDLPAWDPKGAIDSDEAIMVSHNWDEIRRCMWNYVGIVRSNKRLVRAKRRIDIIKQEIMEYYWNFKITLNLIELRNIAEVADLIIMSALLRKESRGLHFNIEYPYKDDASWKKDTVLCLKT
ncbi:MAG: L-aspartate oxidase [Pseudomonadota bacterium]